MRFRGLLLSVAFCVSLPTLILGQRTSGKLFVLGGATNDDSVTIYNALRQATGKSNPNIAVSISAAGSLEVGLEAYYIDEPGSKSYERLFREYGFNPSVIELARDNYLQASSANTTLGRRNIDIVREADVIFFNGGDQARHARSWLNDDGSDSDIMREVRARFADGAVIAGTSAGNAIQCDPTFGEGRSYGYYYFNADLKPCRVGETLVDDRDGSSGFRADENGGYMKGFGFLQDAMLDSHFDARGRFGRLIVTMRDVAKSYGFGVGEDTAFYIYNGTGTVYGSDGVWVVDTTTATYPIDDFFKANNIRVSYLTENDTYTFATKIVTSTKQPITSEQGNAYQSNDVYASEEAIRSMESLISSTSTQSVGYSKDKRPTSRVVFKKVAGTKGYVSNNKYTIDTMLLDIGTL